MYWKYLKYVVVHKWYVLVECFKRGQFWLGITHDLSKFLPDEFIPYAQYFYGNYPAWDEIKHFMPWFTKTKEAAELKFNTAWLKHIHRNKHHWQHWVLINDSSDPQISALRMPNKYRTEMVCDWRGAGKAINGVDDTCTWYAKNKGKQIMHETTKALVAIEVDGVFVSRVKDGD